MNGPQRDLVIETGADWTYCVRWLRNGEPVDLTDWTPAMQVREDAFAPCVLLTLTEANGRIVRGATGVLNLVLTALQTSAITLARFRPPILVDSRSVMLLGVYDLKLSATDGRAIRLIQGRVLLSPAVTR